jgi:hypothetical protein
MTMSKYKTDFLFGENSLLIGAASSFNLYGGFFDYAVSDTPESADAKAIANDWGVIGQDFAEVLSSERK